MSFGFINGAYNRASGTRGAFGQLSDRLVREGHPRMVSRSGDREIADEIAMFVSRFRQQASGSGSFGDVRYWDGRPYGYPGGTRWVRFSPAGTVAPPGKSNHGKRRSNDLAYPYNSDTAASRRAKQIALNYGITREGENFGELWHWTFWGDLGTIDSPATAGIEGEDMPLTTEDLDKIATRVWAHMIQPQDENGNYVTGAFPARGFLSSVAAQAQAAKTAAQAAPAGVWNHLVQAQDAQGNLLKHPDGTPVLWPARGYLASIGGQVGAIQTADVDEKALAAQLAPLLTAQVGALSDEDVARIAAAVSDEQAKRLAS
jgi:hypothetical protein